MRLSADLHSETKSRPLYRAIRPDLSGRDHLLVSTEAPPAALLEPFDGLEIFIHDTGLDGLPQRLAQARTGLRLYAVGSEAFVWDVQRLAIAAGLGEDEIQLVAAFGRRRVRCLHCKAILDDVTQPETVCVGCGENLLVRDHFSRRLAAFQGVARHGVTRGEAPA